MRRRKSKKGLILFTLFLAAAGGAAAYVYMSPEFEREAPEISLPDTIYWNRRAPLEINVSDNRALGSYTIEMGTGDRLQTVSQNTFPAGTKAFVISLPFPKNGLKNPKAKHYKLRITVTDGSLWNLFRGNRVSKTVDVVIDTKRPNVNILANSRMIAQGGSALVVFQAEDETLDRLYVSANEHRFEVVPYKEEGYYAALIAWPFKEETFEAQIVAKDKAGNTRNVHIPYYHKNPKYRTSYIKAKESFINGKISDLAASDPDYADIDDPIEKLKAVNEKMRAKNEALIHTLASKVSDEPIDRWHIRPFRPLKNGKKVASFGDHRYYYIGDKTRIVSESYHLGYDLASVKMAPIVASNPGKVVFADENGIYGNMPMIDHGMGLYTLYGHCSKLSVKEGDTVHAGEVVARTGMTGLALGDHLHFGVLVQGIEVRPVEWFDKKWIKTFIDDVFAEADKIIAPKEESEKRKK